MKYNECCLRRSLSRKFRKVNAQIPLRNQGESITGNPSPPKASRAGLRARQAAKRDTAASTLIHAIVTVCTRWIRRIASGGTTEAIYNIMALYLHLRLRKTV